MVTYGEVLESQFVLQRVGQSNTRRSSTNDYNAWSGHGCRQGVLLNSGSVDLQEERHHQLCEKRISRTISTRVHDSNHLEGLAQLHVWRETESLQVASSHGLVLCIYHRNSGANPRRTQLIRNRVAQRSEKEGIIAVGSIYCANQFTYRGYHIAVIPVCLPKQQRWPLSQARMA
jgi:hypothetical protein